MPAASPGGNAIMNVKTSLRNGKSIMASIGPVGGGGGGTPYGDGSDGAGGATGFLRNTPIEITETEVPIRFLRYGLAPDTGAPGRFRGGLSAIMEFRVSAPETIVTARNRNRSIMPGWGLQGAQAGVVSQFVLNTGAGETQLRNTDLVRCGPGDVIRVVGPGAGGWGDPFDRDPRLVERDVRQGYVSNGSAAHDYGVAIVDGKLDQDATARLRAARSVRAPAASIFTYGSERLAFELLWTVERYDLLTEFLATVPVRWRFFLKHQIFDAVEVQDQTIPVAGQMASIFADMRAVYAL
jgi:N-methylhydantoinase B